MVRQRLSNPEMRHQRLKSQWLVVLTALFVALVTACLGETELVTLPPPPPTTLSLEFRADAEDLATATALGWQDGIPHVEVKLAPADPTQSPRTLRGSAQGTLSLEGLPGGDYTVEAVRWLSDAERGQLPARDDAVGFLVKFRLSTTTASSPVRVPLAASRRRALVISEWKAAPLFVPAIGDYLFSGYLRLYNNADTTIYLDGMIIGRGLDRQFGYPNFPCVLYEPYSTDVSGIWSLFFHQLPGRGTDYPLGPGETALLVTDAIDHRPLFATALDLHGADFEFYSGLGDVDNPAVPNASEVGVLPTPLGHGLYFLSLANVAYVALPLDPVSLHRESLGGTESVWARIPASKLIEIVAARTTYSAGFPECSRLVHPNFDRLEVRLLGADADDDFRALHRIPIPFTINGRAILQHTRASGWDFAGGDRTPFAQP